MPGLFWTFLLVVCVIIDMIFINPFRRPKRD
jgi:hypothetical protein